MVSTMYVQYHKFSKYIRSFPTALETPSVSEERIPCTEATETVLSLNRVHVSDRCSLGGDLRVYRKFRV